MSSKPENVIYVAKKKAPTAAGKTSTELVHVIKSQERNFCQKQKAPAAAGKTSPELDAQMAPAVVVIRQVVSQFEL